MKLTIKKKKSKPLLSRTEVIADIEFTQATPSKEELKEKISSSLKTDAKLVVVKRVSTPFGKKNGEVIAYAYNSESDLKRIEPKQKDKKKRKEEPKE